MSGAMMRGWWANRSGPQRFDLYTRWTLYLIAGAMVVAALLGGYLVEPQQQEVSWIHLVLMVLGSVVGFVVLRSGLDRAVHGGPIPRRALTVYVILMAGAAVTGMIGFGDGDSGSASWPIVVFMHVIAVVSPLLNWRWLSVLAAGLAAVLTAMAAAVGTS